MRIKHRKIFISGTAVAAAGVLGIGTLIQTSLSVQASAEMMPGIETIVDENSSEKPFRILELVNKSTDAEIGYYVSGQEPYIKLYTWQYQDENGDTQTMHFSSLEEGLKKLPTAKLRQEFAANVRLNSDGEIDTTTSTGIRSASGFSGNDVPVTYSDYEEKYFLSSGDTESDWTKIDFTDPTGNKSRTDEVEIKGQYEENTSHTGDYTKGEQEYYPITGDKVDNSKEMYRENIQNFYFSESDKDSRGAYDLDFESVTNDTINNNLSAGENNTLAKEYDPDNGHFGLYENVYEDLTSVIVGNIKDGNFTFPGEKTTRDESVVRKIYDNTTTRIAETADFSSGDVGDSTDASADTDAGSTQAEFGSDTSSQSTASDVQTGGDVSFENSFSDSTADAASGTDSDEWDVSESESDSVDVGADSGSDFGSDFSDEETDEAAVSTEDAGTGDAVDVVDDFSNDGSDGGSEIADTGDGSGNSTGDASEGETTSADEMVGSTELANSIKKVQSNDTVPDENGKQISPDTTGENPGSQSNPYVYVSEQINVFPYYKYTKLGTLAYVKQKQTETEGNTERNDGDIVLENDQYYYYMVTADGTVKYPLTVVTGRQPVSYQDIQKIPESLDEYYYRVSAVYFCCQENTDQSTGYKFTGWYYVNYQDQSNIYIKTESKDIATYYISDASYTLTPGTGDYDFVPDESAAAQAVQVDHIYYKGGYTNNDWFKKYVFHLEPKASADAEDGEFENFNIQVDTMNAGSTGNSLEAIYAAASESDSSDTDAAGQADDSEISVDDSTEEDADSVGENGSDTTQSDTEAEFSDDTDVTETGSESSIQDADDSAENNDEADVDAQADISIEEENADSAGDGASTDDAGTLEDALSEYDLIYVNGKLSTEMAKALEDAVTENTIPCIINNAKDGVANSLDTNMQTDFVKDASADEDGHYVNKYVYFFKNNLDEDTTAQSQLLNVNFHTNFNNNADQDDSYEASEKALGFEEILKYIESENKYRALGGTNDTSQSSDSSADVSDGNTDGSTDGSSTDATNETLDPLSREISQARAIEYIINYKYKRVISGKEQINVLEITPDKLSSADLSNDDILSWVNGKARDTISVCCYHNGNGKDKLEDGDGGTYWDFAWQSGDVYKDHDGHHYIEAVFTEPESVTGFSYTPRESFNKNNNSGVSNGVLKKYKAILTFSNGNMSEIDGEVDITEVKAYEIKFNKTYSSVKSMKIEFVDMFKNKNEEMASCAEFSVLYGNLSDDNKVNASAVITRMTASEFVGHIDDIGSKYDLIYISDSNTYNSKDNLITGADDLRYTHVGEGKLLKWPSSEQANEVSLSKLLGILDIDYYRNVDGTRWEGNIWNYNGNMVEDGNRFESYTKYSVDGAGYYRGSGNDITKQQYTELMNFVKSGYPVVLGDGLVSGSSVNTSEVGASSWYYQFLTDALKYDNVMTRDQAGTDSALEFYMNLAKPQIEFDEKPVEVERAVGTDGKKGTENDGKKYGYITDGQLKYVFKITNNSDVAPASTTYDCRLYMDLNFDGNMSEKENQQKYIEIQDESGNVLSRNSEGQYELKIGKKYTLIRKIPSDYYKVINWKLVLSSNRNSYIHVSETGYAKQQKTDGKQQINVLQLVPDSYYWKNGVKTKKENACTWNLSTDLNSNTKFEQLLEKVEDFELKIEEMQVSDIKYMSYEDMKNKLNSQQMLIIGFADVYQDIPNEKGQVKAILEYIQSGRSVIFSHDTTSYVNYDKTKMNNEIGTYTADDKNPLNVYGDGYLKQENVANVTWGLSLNSTLRSVVGMDRYGVTSDEKITTADGNATTVGALTRKGEVLSDDTVNLETLMELAGDVAYTDGSKSETYVQTQGYSNGVIENTISSHSTTATKVNEGAITEYPFKLGDINVSETHGQYYQLALERDDDKDGCNDVVVWYCLSGSKYDNSPNDVRNNYYFYSKGNVIYTGAGHSAVNQEDEIKLFINAIVAAANVSAVDPDVNFVSELNPAAQVETSRYYATDQANWPNTSSEGNLLEKDMQFYLNIKDYNMVSASLSSENEGTENMTVQFFVDKNGTQLGTPNEDSLENITNKIAGLTTYGTGAVINISGNSFSIGNNAYAFTVRDIEQYLKTDSDAYRQNCKIYAKVTSKVTLYGQEYTKTKWASIDLKQRQLFEMD